MKDLTLKDLSDINTKAEEKHSKDIQAYKTALGILSERDPGCAATVQKALYKAESDLAEVRRSMSTLGSEYDFVKDAIARRDKKA